MSASLPTVSGPRLEWSEVPDHVRTAVESELGASVVSATTQLGGFSPGAAARVALSDGRRAFVKACGSEINPDTPDLNRAEVAALRVLPEDVPAPRLVMSYDDGEWVALVLEDVEGRRPGVPWTDSDVAAVSTSLDSVASVRGAKALPAFADLVHALTAWDEVAADPAGVPDRLVARLPEMLDLQARAREVTRGESLVHWDARSDNVLIRPDGEAVLLDWAWACRGAPWLDTLLLGLDFVVQGGPDPDGYLRSAGTTRDSDPEDLRAVVACMVGVWTERGRHAAPPGLPTIRAWQARCATASLEWLDEGTLWT